MGDPWSVKKLQTMLKHETSKTEKHYGAKLQYWFGDSKIIVDIDAGGIRALIRYYKKHKKWEDENDE